MLWCISIPWIVKVVSFRGGEILQRTIRLLFDLFLWRTVNTFAINNVIIFFMWNQMNKIEYNYIGYIYYLRNIVSFQYLLMHVFEACLKLLTIFLSHLEQVLKNMLCWGVFLSREIQCMSELCVFVVMRYYWGQYVCYLMFSHEEQLSQNYYIFLVKPNEWD